MIDIVQNIVAPLKRKINLFISKCTINITDDTCKTQINQIELFTGEVRDEVENWQRYGFTSYPPNGSEAVCIFPGGDRSNGVIIATEDKDSRINNLNEGEVCLYTKSGDKVYLKNGSILLETKKFSVKNDTDELVDLFYQTLEILSTTTTNTLMGAMPLNDSIRFGELKIKIDSFREKVK